MHTRALGLRGRLLIPALALSIVLAGLCVGSAFGAAPSPNPAPGAAATGLCGTRPAVVPVVPGRLVLPSPERPDLLSGVPLGVKPDRLLCSHVPGPVSNIERVLVGLAGGGLPTVVMVEQHLSLQGTGNYVIRERGPARIVTGLNDTVPPVLQRGTVVWEGFVPVRRDLAALLTLDAGLEAARLPLAVSLAFTPAGGGPSGTLGPGGHVPGPGVVTITLTNQTTLAAQQVPTGTGRAPDVAAALSVLQAAAQHPGIRPPTAGHGGLPASVGISGELGARFLDVTVPLRVTGSVAVRGASGQVQVSGPGTRPTSAGADVAGTLTAAVTLTITVPSSATLDLDLTAVPTLDPRTLRPPPPATSWAAWAAGQPGEDARLAATEQLVNASAVTAALTSYAPYLAAGLDGPVTTSFHLAMAPPPPVLVTVARLHARPVPIAATVLAVLLAFAGLGWLRRRL